MQRKAAAEKLPLNVTTIFSVRYCAGSLFRPRRMGREPCLIVDAVEHEGESEQLLAIVAALRAGRATRIVAPEGVIERK